uniref:Uncharacterized protein n=1 Tax=Rhizophora mucronata TaxID=61149 RepID=A0A2P2QA84_RHIMU
MFQDKISIQNYQKRFLNLKYRLVKIIKNHKNESR